MTGHRESVLRFDCQGEPLVGILAEPTARPAAEVAILIVVGGPQYRAGSHRQFTLLARQLADHGFTALRFDGRGMGDSGGEQRSFEALDDDIGAAMLALRQAAPAARRIVIWGLCDAVSAALLYLHRRGGDDRVAGLVLLNPWVRSAQGQARTQVRHYYLDRLRQREFWTKLLSGRVAFAALKELATTAARALRARDGAAQAGELDFRTRMAQAWAVFPGDMLLILSGEDYTAKEFLDQVQQAPAWRHALQRPRLTRQDCPEMDHTFSLPDGKAMVAGHTLAWLNQLASRP